MTKPHHPAVTYIIEHGKRYEPAVLPPGFIYGAVGDCFDECIRTLIRFDINGIEGYKYVEGLAEDPKNKGRWILHAWLTDGERAYDLTWRCEGMIDGVKFNFAVPTTYIGIEMDMECVADFVRTTGHKSILANGNLDSLRTGKCLPQGFPAFSQVPNVIWLP